MTRWDPWRGCHKCSDGCLHCYIHKGDAKRNVDTSQIVQTRQFSYPIERKNNGEYKMKTSLVYVCFSSDFLIEEADDWRVKCWKMIKERQDCTFLFLTKRIERFLQCIPSDWGTGYDNVVVCCTIENQKNADKKLSIFSKCPIKHKVIVAQPMIGPIQLESYLKDIEQVIVGGESDKEARPLYYDWVLDLRQQCIRKGVSFEFRQCGTHFVKDGIFYTLQVKDLMKQARKANINYKGNGINRMVKKEKVVLYVHGKGGSIQEANDYKQLFVDTEVIGFDYKSENPWDAKEEFSNKITELAQKYHKIDVIANSIGAFFLMQIDNSSLIQKAYFISPIVNMERLILDMMSWANVSEAELKEKKEILTDFGEILSWDYLEYVRSHPIDWKVKTHVLYGEKDNLTSFNTMCQFVKDNQRDLTVMTKGEHWFHTMEQMDFLHLWIQTKEYLIDRIEYVHTTKMGMERIKKNLGIEVDGVEYCRKKILDSKSTITRKGKNWYCETDTEIITINANSLTIITAHRK